MPPVHGPVPKRCCVTGGSGFVGQRLVEMLVERGAERVVSFDRSPKPAGALDDPRVVYLQGDLRRLDDGAQCVWHVAALVGPFHERKAYYEVNYVGTLNVIEACKRLGVPKIVMSSSPSTRFDGSDIRGKSADELPIRPPGRFLQPYAESKAQGEVALRGACCPALLTVAVAPHQVYGPRDTLFLHEILLAARRVRVFGTGTNLCSFCHVDNYAHGLILAEAALVPGSPALGGFYIVTDGEPQNFWRAVDAAVTAVGCRSVFAKLRLPGWLILPVAHLAAGLGWLLGRRFRLTPFSARMLMIHRWFDIEKSRRDLGYEPLVGFEQGWADTVAWFKTVWLPKHKHLM